MTEAGWTRHELKCWPEYFQAVKDGLKTFEIRKNDRGFKVGDWLDLQEWSPATQAYTGRSVKRQVVYCTDWEQKPGHVVMGLRSPTDRQQGKVEGIQESKNLVSEFIEAWLLAGMVAKLLTPAVHEAVGGLSRDLRRELQKIEQAAQDEKGVGDGKDCL